MLKHPRIAEEPVTVGADQPSHVTVAPRADCRSCHDTAHDFRNATLPYQSYYGGSGSRWLYYYETPWWVEPQYYSENAVAEDEELPSPRQYGKRRFGRNQAAAGETAVGVPANTSAGASPVKAKRTAKSETTQDSKQAGDGAKKEETRRAKKKENQKTTPDKKRRVRKKSNR